MITFLNPFWLITIPIAAGLLLYVYLRHGKNKQIKVSSLFFIQKLKPSQIGGKRKISIPWRMILEILVCTFLLAALSGLLLKDQSERAVIIIDNSLSMGSKVSASDKTILLDEAKKSAISNLDFLSKIQTASVWVTSPYAKEISAGYVSNQEAKKLISEISLSYSEGSIGSVFSRLKDNSSNTLIFSDQIVTELGSNYKTQHRLVPLNLEYSKRYNVALHSLALQRDINDEEQNIIVKLHSFSAQETICLVKIYAYLNNKWNRIFSNEITLPNAGVKEQLIKLDSNYKNIPNKIFRAEIEACSPEGSNLLELDDKVWYAAESSSNQIVLVSNFTPKEVGLEKINGISFAHIKPNEWNQFITNQNNLEDLNSRLIIFHRYLPNKFPDTNFLSILPSEANNFFKIKSLKETSRLVRWDQSNPILQYLKLPDLNFNEASLFLESPAWASPLIFSENGVVAIAGSFTKNKIAAIGFEIFPYEGKDNPFASVLTLNLIKWLSKESSQIDSSLSLKLDPKDQRDSARYLDSISGTASLSVNSEKVLNLTAPGLIEIKNLKADKLLAINFYSESESNLNNPGIINLPKNSANLKSQQVSSGYPLETYLLALAICMLLTEILYLFIRRKHAS